MHFGKKLLGFIPLGFLRNLDYKALKGIIKSEEFHLFFDAMLKQIDTVSASVAKQLLSLETLAGRAQLALMKSRLLFSRGQLREYKTMFNITNVNDGQFANDCVKIFAEADDRESTEEAVGLLAELVQQFNHLTAFLEINACGFRKIIKKFTKRSDNMPSPAYGNFFDAQRVADLFETIRLLRKFGAPEPAPLGEETIPIFTSQAISIQA